MFFADILIPGLHWYNICAERNNFGGWHTNNQILLPKDNTHPFSYLTVYK